MATTRRSRSRTTPRCRPGISPSYKRENVFNWHFATSTDVRYTAAFGGKADIEAHCRMTDSDPTRTSGGTGLTRTRLRLWVGAPPAKHKVNTELFQETSQACG